LPPKISVTLSSPFQENTTCCLVVVYAMVDHRVLSYSKIYILIYPQLCLLKWWLDLLYELVTKEQKDVTSVGANK
jgi:hypothetical protein